MAGYPVGKIWNYDFRWQMCWYNSWNNQIQKDSISSAYHFSQNKRGFHTEEMSKKIYYIGNYVTLKALILCRLTTLDGVSLLQVFLLHLLPFLFEFLQLCVLEQPFLVPKLWQNKRLAPALFTLFRCTSSFCSLITQASIEKCESENADYLSQSSHLVLLEICWPFLIFFFFCFLNHVM